MPSGRFRATNATDKGIILEAFELVEGQLIGAPGWLSADRFDIAARTASPPEGPRALLPLVRALLVERFALRAHTDTRELPAYALTLARRDQRAGMQMRPSQATAREQRTWLKTKSAPMRVTAGRRAACSTSSVSSQPGPTGMR